MKSSRDPDEVILGVLATSDGRQYRVRGWKGYGVVIPGLSPTKGDPEAAARLIRDHTRDGARWYAVADGVPDDARPAYDLARGLREAWRAAWAR